MNAFARLGSVSALGAWMSLGTAQTGAPTAQALRALEQREAAWTGVAASVPLHERADVTLTGIHAGGFGAGGAILELPLHLSRALQLTPAYFYLAGPPLLGADINEHRLRLDATLRVPLPAGWELQDRNLVERRFRAGFADSTRYRQRLRLEHPVRLGNMGVNAFAWGESFYDCTASAWTRHWVAAGVGKTVATRLTVEVAYLRQIGPRAPFRNIIFTTVLLRLDGPGGVPGRAP